jgi:hypothetical protein
VAPDEFRLLVVISPVLLVRVMLPPLNPLPVERESKLAVVMSSAAESAIAPPSPELELELRVPVRVSIVPLVLVRLIPCAEVILACGDVLICPQRN